MTTDPTPESPAAALAIVEIAGRDSVAAAIKAVEQRPDIRMLLPTIVVTGTELGDTEAPVRAVEFLRQKLQDHTQIAEPAHVGSVPLWRALNARFASEIKTRFNVCSPCLACHLYMHLARVPLAWLVGSKTLISGERDSHAGKLKLSQLPQAIDASIEVMAYAGIEFIEPIRHEHGSQEIERLVGPDWPQGGKQLECVLSGNYVGLNGEVTYDTQGYERFIREYFVPVGKTVIDAWREAGVTERPDAEEPDYEALVRAVLER